MLPWCPLALDYCNRILPAAASVHLLMTAGDSLPWTILSITRCLHCCTCICMLPRYIDTVTSMPTVLQGYTGC